MILDKIDKDLLQMSKDADHELKDIYQNIDDICLYNSNRILSAFIENSVSYSDFADINGYGNYDEGRDKIEKIFATVLGCEDALVRPQIMSGTNAIYLALSALYCGTTEPLPFLVNRNNNKHTTNNTNKLSIKNLLILLITFNNILFTLIINNFN